MLATTLRGALVGAAVVTFMAPLSAHAQQDRASGTEKGSVLLFPKVELMFKNAGSGGLLQDTMIHLTNDYPGAVRVKLFFVNGDAPCSCCDGGGGNLKQGEGCRDHPGWNHLDNVIELTANEAAWWSAGTGVPKGVSPFSVLDPGPPPGRLDPNDPTQRVLRGYIVAFAVDGITGNEISWNHLAGDATIVNYRYDTAWQYNAYAFQAQEAPHGEETGTPGALNLNGIEFTRGYSHLLMNFIGSGSGAYSQGEHRVEHDTDLTLLPISSDFRQEGDGPVTTKVTFEIWNENEVKFTNLDRCVTCWDQELVSRHAIPNHFMRAALQTDGGKARMDGVASQVCPGSTAASLVGVAAKMLFHENSSEVRASAAANLIGMGVEAGVIRYDTQGPPPPGRWSPSTPEELIEYMLDALER